MSKVVVIGATGHIGTYLVPRLVMAGHDVTAVSRGQAKPYQQNGAWRHVTPMTLDRSAEEKAGRFGATIADLNADVVIDLICFTETSHRQLADALAGRVTHFIHIGTIWTHGASSVAPTLESAEKHPFGDYGIAKAAIEANLLRRAHRDGFPATIIHPGHIVGPGWAPLNPAGHFNTDVFSIIARGETLALPNFGQETVHHVHADDVAQIIVRAMENRSVAIGESFHAVSGAAISLRGYAEAMYRWFGHAPALSFAGFEEWKKTQDLKDAEATWEHIIRSPSCSIEKGRRLLGYTPRYTSLEAVDEAVTWLVEQGQVSAAQ